MDEEQATALAIERLATKIAELSTSQIRMENSLTEMAKAITRLVAVEIHQAHYMKTLDALTIRVDNLSTAVHALQVAEPGHNQTKEWVRLGLIAMASAALMYVAKSTGLI